LDKVLGQFHSFKRIKSGYCSACAETHKRAGIRANVYGNELVYNCWQNKLKKELKRIEIPGEIPIDKVVVKRTAEEKRAIRAKYINMTIQDLLCVKPLPLTGDIIQTINTKYISSLDSKCPLLAVRSIKGSGKSVALRKLLESIPANTSILLLSFRRSYARSISGLYKAMGFRSYTTIKNGILSISLSYQMTSLY